jgi:hypothetical protein
MSGIVDRLLAQLPGLHDSDPVRATARPAVAQSGISYSTVRAHQSASPRELLGVWARVLLGLTLAIMMAGWPYLRTCGLPLFGYLGAIVTVILAGGFAAVVAWRYRAGLAHVVSLIVVLYGFMMGAAELLPRTGYAVDRATWECQDSAPSFSSVAS